ncbi:hypothetical protein F4776DRAFT_87806 [Hypoxylon sp. NC0597]|nr:hypothetical protein F4776DRAFT_87806 [Hypoxylon sp. NC0597]
MPSTPFGTPQMTAHYCFLACSISTTGENWGVRPEISFPLDRCGHAGKGQKRSGDDDFKDARGSPRGNHLVELRYSELVSLRNAPSCNM